MGNLSTVLWWYTAVKMNIVILYKVQTIFYIFFIQTERHPVKRVFYILAIEVNGQFCGDHYFVHSVHFIVQTVVLNGKMVSELE